MSLLGMSANAPAAGAQEGGPPNLTATPGAITLDSVQDGARSASGRAAKTDDDLLNLTSADPVSVVVKLDYDSLAAYTGDVEGLAATSPTVTGRPLDPDSAASQDYLDYAGGVESTFVDALDSAIPAAQVGSSLKVLYGGVAVRVPGNKIAELAKLPGVAAVQPNELRQPSTDSSPDFIGATPVYPELGGVGSSGAGVIVGVLDTGAWPEHPSYTDPGNLPAPPARTDGNPRPCNFGDNPLTPANDPFVCNNKLIGGQVFLDTYLANIDQQVFPEVFPAIARDSNGHGTHTSTTAAGGPANANPLGINRGAIHGIAPAASISVYKVCGIRGCFDSDSVAAAQQAIIDRVDVINFSIGGGNDPYADAVELAFLDLYAAGTFVSTSAGNDGPGAATTGHNGPWVSTVAASTQARAFQSTVTLHGTGGASASLVGNTITAGITTPLPVVLASAPPYNNAACNAPAPAGLFTGKIVVCLRRIPADGIGRVERGFNVFQGGAAGMLLRNEALSDTETDNHFLPTVHLEQPAGDALVAFLAANPGATASFTQGVAATGQGDVVAGFSSRGPGTEWIKPDLSAPGVQILAGHTPVPDELAGGPPGNLYQAIAGTSMASPHVAGAAALLMDLHPDWTPGQVRSALQLTANTNVVKTDTVTPADPFDVGSGRIQVDAAAHPNLTLDESAANFAAAATDPLGRIDLNIASIDAPAMPGTISTTRTVTNVTTGEVRYRSSATSPAGSTISVSPKNINIPAGGSADLTVTISAAGIAPGQYFGQVMLEDRNGDRDLHMPVAFSPGQGALALTQVCDPTTIGRPDGRSTCTVTAQNNSRTAATVNATTHLDSGLRVTAVNGATQTSNRDVSLSTTLNGVTPGVPTIAPGTSPGGYIPLDLFGVTPIPVGDEQALNFNVPAFTYGGLSYDRVGVTSDGYLVAGGTTGAADIQFDPTGAFGTPGRPNNVLAPFWTDLDGTGAPGILATVLTDGVNSWLVIEWRLNVFGTSSLRVFQTWLGIDGTEDNTFAYDPANLPAAPRMQPFIVGAENLDGTAASSIAGLPTGDLRVTSTPFVPGQTLTYSVQVKGVQSGAQRVTTSVDTPIVHGTTQEVDTINVL
ncbi:MAG TPA: S8 family serine peptidase [Acidimicrobiales bacterium]